jgi:demethylmenaquinone methyltransferase/2-methoxy-6-polyprenyl-1,4-benzoquinol methylase
MKGTTPEGITGEKEAAQWVRGMFGRIADRYDFANHLLSFSIDRLWRAATVRRVRAILDRPDARILDICCGTGDLLFALERRAGGRSGPVMGSDFCHPMLVRAGRKIGERRSHAVLFESDALRLPVRDASLDLITVAFGFRNLANYDDGLREMRRVLRPGGMAAILEFSQPRSRLFGAIYHIYCRHLLPVIGALITGSRDAYAYLPESVRKFPGAAELAERMQRAGFADVHYDALTGGAVAIHVGQV